MKEQNNQQNIAIARIQKDIDWIIVELKNIRDNHLNSIYSKLSCLDKKVNSRPTWFVSMGISSLFALSVGLIVYLVTK